MKTSKRALILLMSLAAVLNACEMKENLDEMHDSTVEMNKTTREMNQTTSEMNERTSGLEEATGELYDALRQGDSLAARRAALENLINTEDSGRKLSEAAKYFMSFEFQFWTDSNQDKGQEKRMFLATSGAREFFKDIHQFIPNGDMTPNPFAGQIHETSKSNLVNSFNALATTTHFMNPKQEAHLAQKPGMKALSMNIMIEESLLAKASIESGAKKISDYPGYVHEVLANEQAAVYLLEARYNYLGALFLGRATSIATSKFTAARYVATKWSLDLSKFNSAQIEEFNSFLKGALLTKNTLLKAGVKPRTHFLLARMLNNMTLVDLTKEPKINAVKTKAFHEINARIKELKKF